MNTQDILENTTGAAEVNVGTTDQNLNVGALFQEAELPSLGRLIFSIVPMTGPTAAFFNVRKKTGSNELEVLRNNAEVYPSEAISTGLTKEAIQDMMKQYPTAAAGNMVGTLLRGLANDQENTRTLAFLEAKALSTPALTLSTPANAETNFFEITQRVQELVLQANSKNHRTFDAFCVLPFKALGGIQALSKYADSSATEGHDLEIARINKTTFYMNPDANATTAYVGLKDRFNPSRSSGVFSPYTGDIIESVNPDNGDMIYNIYNRFAITENPLHEVGNEMHFKFVLNM